MSDTEQAAAKAAAAVSPRRSGMVALLALVMAVGVACAGYYWTHYVAEPGVSALRARLDDGSSWARPRSPCRRSKPSSEGGTRWRQW